MELMSRALLQESSCLAQMQMDLPVSGLLETKSNSLSERDHWPPTAFLVLSVY